MYALIASHPEIRYILMYCKNPSGRADSIPNQEGHQVYQDIKDFFAKQIDAALQAGVRRDQIILDPGMGAFISQDPQDSILVLRNIRSLKAEFGLPILVGASRKGFLKSLSPTRDFGANCRLGTSLACALYAAQQGADFLRVHDVLPTTQLLHAYPILVGN
eukprot:TRINITY_DN3309_c0_g1_i1.p1 TRINITY_DN3309_c0_g1~~TRINITY_DN3309_c0_g1_i1.p1  ORF type:complete len:161 (-),score=19.64 TRINITY_DN3309_c0_g1_i1:5-487(-)